MLALGAGIEAGQAVLDTVLNTGVIAGLEMEAVVVRLAAPMSAVKRIVAEHHERHPDRSFTMIGYKKGKQNHQTKRLNDKKDLSGIGDFYGL